MSTDWYTDGDRRGENDQIYDLPALPPNASDAEVMDWLRMLAQWMRTREPVAEGSIFTKFMTYGAAVRLKLLDEQDLIGDDDDPGTGNDDTNVDDTFVDIYARDMTPSVTAGCSAFTTIETASNKPNLHVLLFDPTTSESAQFALLMPKGWVGGSIQYQVYWSHGSGGSGFGVKWSIEPQASNDGESMSVAWNGSKDVTDIGGVADTLYISPFSEAVRIDPSVTAEGDLIFFKISRLPADAADTLNIDARLHAIRFNTGEVAVVDKPPLPTYTGTVLLRLNFDGTHGATTFADSGPNAFTVTGDATTAYLSNAHSKFGSTSLRLGSRNPTMSAITSSVFDQIAANEPVTVSVWVYHVASLAVTAAPQLWRWQQGGGAYDTIKQYSLTAKIEYDNEQVGPAMTAVAYSSGAWTHVEWGFDGTTAYLFINGALAWSGARNRGLVTTGGVFYIANFSTPIASDGTEVYIENLFVLRGQCLHTAAFTPPTARY